MTSSKPKRIQFTVPILVLTAIAALDSADKALLGASFPMLEKALGLHGKCVDSGVIVHAFPNPNHFTTLNTLQSIHSDTSLYSQTCPMHWVSRSGAGYSIDTP